MACRGMAVEWADVCSVWDGSILSLLVPISLPGLSGSSRQRAHPSHHAARPAAHRAEYFLLGMRRHLRRPSCLPMRHPYWTSGQMTRTAVTAPSATAFAMALRGSRSGDGAFESARCSRTQGTGTNVTYVGNHRRVLGAEDAG